MSLRVPGFAEQAASSPSTESPRGYFTPAYEILWNPEDKRCPYSLVVDTRTWVEIRRIKTKRFRSFTSNAPPLEEVERVEGNAQSLEALPDGRIELREDPRQGGSTSGRE